MAEVTRIITVEFTKVFKNNCSPEGYGERIDKGLKTHFGYSFDDIKIAKIQDFVFPYQKTPKLTKKERLFCELMGRGYFARSAAGTLWWCEEKPEKDMTFNAWRCDDENPSMPVVVWATKTCFDFIQWEDSEPWAVEDLLKLEVEE